MTLQEITQNTAKAFAELDEINAEIVKIADFFLEERMREGLVYLKIDKKGGVAYPRWAVLLFSKKNGKPFSKSLGTQLTKKLIKETHNGRRMQTLLPASKKIKELLTRRKQLTNVLKSCTMRLRALYPKAQKKKGSVIIIE